MRYSIISKGLDRTFLKKLKKFFDGWIEKWKYSIFAQPYKNWIVNCFHILYNNFLFVKKANKYISLLKKIISFSKYFNYTKTEIQNNESNNKYYF